MNHCELERADRKQPGKCARCNKPSIGPLCGPCSLLCEQEERDEKDIKEEYVFPRA